MNTHDTARPQQLKALIDESLSRFRRQLESGGRIDTPPQNLTMYLGSRQGTYPKLLMQHPLLQPIDKVVWLTLKDQLEEAGAHLACLDASATVTKVGVDSKKTVASALLILRALRLVIYYKIDQGRNDKGRFMETPMTCLVFDETLSLADTLVLDPDYLEFLSELGQHRQKRVRQIAHLIQRTLHEEIGRKDDLFAPRTHLDQIAARQTAQEYVEQKEPLLLEDDNPFFGVEYPHIETHLSERKEAEIHRGKNFPAVNGYIEPGSLYENHRGKNLPTAVTGSDSNINFINKINNLNNNKKTTTTTPTPPPAISPAEDLSVPRWDTSPTSELVWPPSLSQDERAVSALLLETVTPQWRQGVLDELEGRIRWGKSQNDPLRNKVRWLKAVCDEVSRTDILTPSLGEPVRAERAAKQAQAKSHESNRPVEPAKPIDRVAGKTALAQLRKATGI